MFTCIFIFLKLFAHIFWNKIKNHFDIVFGTDGVTSFNISKPSRSWEQMV